MAANGTVGRAPWSLAQRKPSSGDLVATGKKNRFAAATVSGDLPPALPGYGRPATSSAIRAPSGGRTGTGIRVRYDALCGGLAMAYRGAAGLYHVDRLGAP